MVVVSIETIGTERVIRGFSRMDAKLHDLRPVFEEIREDFYEVEERNFRRGGYPQKHKPLSPGYAKWKARVAPGKPIMTLHGRLRDSMTGQGARGDTIDRRRRKFAEFGSKVPYAHRHQMGTMGMPQRRFVQLNEAIKRRWSKLIHEFVIKGFTETGGFHIGGRLLAWFK